MADCLVKVNSDKDSIVDLPSVFHPLKKLSELKWGIYDVKVMNDLWKTLIKKRVFHTIKLFLIKPNNNLKEMWVRSIYTASF